MAERPKLDFSISDVAQPEAPAPAVKAPALSAQRPQIDFNPGATDNEVLGAQRENDAMDLLHRIASQFLTGPKPGEAPAISTGPGGGPAGALGGLLAGFKLANKTNEYLSALEQRLAGNRTAIPGRPFLSILAGSPRVAAETGLRFTGDFFASLANAPGVVVAALTPAAVKGTDEFLSAGYRTMAEVAPDTTTQLVKAHLELADPAFRLEMVERLSR